MNFDWIASDLLFSDGMEGMTVGLRFANPIYPARSLYDLTSRKNNGLKVNIYRINNIMGVFCTILP